MKSKNIIIKIYKYSLIYFPFILISLLIIFIYSTYTLNYILPLINPNSTLPQNAPYSLIQLYFPNSYLIISKILFIIITWCIVLTFLSFSLTAFSDPGYLPSPIDFELKQISNQNTFCYSNLNINKKRFKFISKFNSLTENGPMTQMESYKLTQIAKENLQYFSYNEYIDDETLPFTYNDSVIPARVPKRGSYFNNNIYRYYNKKGLNDNIIDKYQKSHTVNIENLNLCTNCARWKPERCHHCKVCNKCVLKMDHHCPWLANCIGFSNYKFFVLSIIYGFMSSFIILITYWEFLVDIIISEEESVWYCVLNTFAFMCNIILFSFDSYLLYSNWTSVLRNITTIERSDMIRFGTINNAKGSKYDKGIGNNLKEVFGDKYILWFLPISAN